MSKLRKIGNITHGEKYEKNGETKYKNTQLGTLFRDDEKSEYVVKYLGQWCKVWTDSPRQNTTNQNETQQNVPVAENEIPF